VAPQISTSSSGPLDAGQGLQSRALIQVKIVALAPIERASGARPQSEARPLQERPQL